MPASGERQVAMLRQLAAAHKQMPFNYTATEQLTLTATVQRAKVI